MGRVRGGWGGRGMVYIVKKYISEGCMTYVQFSLVHSSGPAPPKKVKSSKLFRFRG